MQVYLAATQVHSILTIGYNTVYWLVHDPRHIANALVSAQAPSTDKGPPMWVRLYQHVQMLQIGFWISVHFLHPEPS